MKKKLLLIGAPIALVGIMGAVVAETAQAAPSSATTIKVQPMKPGIKWTDVAKFVGL